MESQARVPYLLWFKDEQAPAWKEASTEPTPFAAGGECRNECLLVYRFY